MHAVIELLEILFRFLKTAPEWAPRIIASLIKLGDRLIETAFLPESFFLFSISTILLIVLLFSSGFIQYIFAMLSKKRNTIFLSYQNDFQELAEELKLALSKNCIKVKMLPFNLNIEHDDLLDSIKKEITTSGVVVCLPGTGSSFVEHEVAMAYGLGKPLLFILDSESRNQLPNTAKKGYPVFDIIKLQEDDYETFCRFTSYVLADQWSTLRLFVSVFQNLKACFISIILIYIILIFSATTYFSITDTVFELQGASKNYLKSIINNPVHLTFFTAGVLLYLIPYSLFFLNRYVLRYEMRNAITGRRFDYDLLPTVLEYSLLKENIKKNLIRGNVYAHYEQKNDNERKKLLLKPNISKVSVYFFVVLLASVLYFTFFIYFISDFYYMDTFFNLLFIGIAIMYGYVLIRCSNSILRVIAGLFRGGYLKINNDGFIDLIQNRSKGQIQWSDVYGVSVDNEDKTLTLLRRNGKNMVNINLRYYKISPNQLAKYISAYTENPSI